MAVTHYVMAITKHMRPLARCLSKRGTCAAIVMAAEQSVYYFYLSKVRAVPEQRVKYEQTCEQGPSSALAEFWSERHQHPSEQGPSILVTYRAANWEKYFIGLFQTIYLFYWRLPLEVRYLTIIFARFLSLFPPPPSKIFF